MTVRMGLRIQVAVFDGSTNNLRAELKELKKIKQYGSGGLLPYPLFIGDKHEIEIRRI